jgi:TolB-like protein/Tfp pilus assembly protein PilF
MKRCPECNRVETDEALKFCRVDGATLVSDSSAIGEAGTAQLGAESAASEVHTSILPHNTQANSNRATGPTTSLPQASVGATREISKARPNKTLIVAIVFVVIAAIVLGVFMTRRLTASKSDHGIESVAVLPFENATGNADSEYLSDGLAESLIYRLSRVPNLKVTPRSSVFRYKGKSMDAEKIGADLGVDAVMSGRLIQRGDDLIISVDLIDVKNKKTLWGDQFQRKMADLLATQQEITAAIADKLRLRFSGNDTTGMTKQYTTNNEAYQLYLQGRYFWNKRSSGNLQKATELLKAATEKDPNFALAYAGLADCYAVSYYYVGVRPREMMPLAKTYATKAIELDPTLAEPHTTLAFSAWLLEWDRSVAEKEFQKAFELNPNYPTAHQWYSRYLRGIGRADEAFREIKRAEELDPLSLVIINNIAENYIDRGDLNSATKECQRMLDLDPNFWAAHQTLGIVLIKQGRYDEALAEAQKSAQFSTRGNASLAFLGHVYGRMGRQSETAAVIRELEQRYADKQADGRDLAVLYAGLDKEKAFAWLEKAFADHSVFMAFLKLEPLLEPLRTDPRWSDLERRVGISQ